MRCIAVLACLSAFSVCLASGEATGLKELYEGHQWFRLREAVLAAPNPPLFYRAVVALAFHDDDGADRMFQEVIRAAPDSWEAGEAERLAPAFGVRSGRASHLSVAKPRACRIRYSMIGGNLHIPLTINGRKVKYLLDTGAVTSVVSESEARRLGLEMHNLDETVTDGATGGKIPLRHAGIARRLSIGSTVLRNAMFFVFPDDTFFFKGRVPGENGIIGLPEIQALGTVRWDADGNFDIGFPSAPLQTAKPNLAFEDGRVVVEVGFEGHRLIFGLDTGAVDSGLYVSFRNQFPELVNASGEKRKRTGGGASGTVEYDAIILPELRLHAGGLETLLRPVSLNLNEDLGSGHDGGFGLDLLNQARVVTFDFRAMRLTLEGRRPGAEFQTLFASNQWYKLREAATAPAAPPFYRGVAGCAFNDATACERNLSAAIKIAPDSELAYTARAFLTYQYLRTGRPRQALEQIKEMHKRKPNATDVGGGLGFLTVLGRYPNQRVAKRAPSRIPFTADGLVVPVAIDGRQAEYSLDVSSPWNAIRESEAKRLGLATRRVTGGWSGAQGVADASRLTIGKVELRHVAFLVFRDDQAGPRGRLGLPVMLALGAIRGSNGAALEIGLPSLPGTAPNLRFDGYAVMAQTGGESGTSELPLNMDFLRQSRSVTLDLDAMKLQLR